MADQQRWFKFWHSALSDHHLNCLSVADRWGWVVLGAHTKTHGTHGKVVLSCRDTVLAAAMGVPPETLKDVIKRLPHVDVTERKNHDGEFTVTWRNWIKYQEDSTVAGRMRKLRSKKRREERRYSSPVRPPLAQGEGRTGESPRAVPEIPDDLKDKRRPIWRVADDK